MAVTIKDVAKEAGVSYSTVSRALNGIGTENKEKQKRIVEIAERMGYTRNQAAVNLKLSRILCNRTLFFYHQQDDVPLCSSRSTDGGVQRCWKPL